MLTNSVLCCALNASFLKIIFGILYSFMSILEADSRCFSAIISSSLVDYSFVFVYFSMFLNVPVIKN